MRFSKPVMVVPEPPRWSTIAVITQLSSLGFVPAYLPLLLSNLSLRSSFTLVVVVSFSLFLSPFSLSALSISLYLHRLLSSSPLAVSSSFYLDPIPSWTPLTATLFLWSIINPSIPSRSFHPHITRACTHAGSSASAIPTVVCAVRGLESLFHD